MERTYDDWQKIEGVNMLVWDYCAGDDELDQYESYLEIYQRECYKAKQHDKMMWKRFIKINKCFSEYWDHLIPDEKYTFSNAIIDNIVRKTFNDEEFGTVISVLLQNKRQGLPTIKLDRLFP